VEQSTGAAGMEHRIVVLEDFDVIGLSLECRGGPEGIGNLWERFFERYEELPPPQGLWGVSFGHGDGSFTYLACVGAAEGAVAPEGMVKRTVPGGRFAVWPFKGEPYDMYREFGAIFEQRLPAAGLTVQQPVTCLELYPTDAWDEATGTLAADLYVAVE
jgi:predicted transcriptional regulator YdeE